VVGIETASSQGVDAVMVDVEHVRRIAHEGGGEVEP
jgi:hypothetical protein